VPTGNEPVTLDDLDNAPAELEGAGIEIDLAEYEKVRVQFVQISDEKAKLQIEYDRLKSANRASEILDELIEPFANKTFIFMCAYCGFVGIVLLMNAFNCFKNPMSDAVLQILVGSTAATVIGLVGMVLTGIFVGARHKSN
jgi:hypothetical protein